MNTEYITILWLDNFKCERVYGRDSYGNFTFSHERVKNIYAEKGTKVKCVGMPSKEQTNWGGHDEAEGRLEVGKVYTIDRTEVHSWHTKVFLKEFPNLSFNNVCFEEI